MPKTSCAMTFSALSPWRSTPPRSTAAAPAVTAVHGGAVRDVRVSRDGKLIASAGADGVVKVWSAERLAPLATLQAKGEQRAVALSADGTQLVAGGDDGVARIWTLGKSGEAPLEVNCGAPIRSVTFAGKDIAAVASGKLVKLIRITGGKAGASDLAGHTAEVQCVTASPDGRRLISGGNDDTVRVWDVAAGQEVSQISRAGGGAVIDAAFSPDGTHVLLIDKRYGMLEFDADTGKLVMQHLMLWSIDYQRASWSPDGKWCGCMNNVRGGMAIFPSGVKDSVEGVGNGLWRLTAGQFVDAGRIVCGTADGRVVMFQAPSSANDFPPEIVQSGVSLLGVSSDGVYGLSSGPRVGKVVDLVWDLEKKSVVKKLENAFEPLLSPDHRMIADLTSGKKGAIRIEDLQTGAKHLLSLGISSTFGVMAFSADGSMIAFGPGECDTDVLAGEKGPVVRLFEVASGKMLHKFTGHRQGITGLAFSPDGRMLVTRSGNSSITIDRDGKVIPPDLSLHVWSTADGRELKVFPGGSPYVSECFTPDSKKLITVTKDGLIVVYEAGTFEELTRTRLPRAGSTTGAAISPDGRYLLVGYRHADARLISVDQLKVVGKVTLTINDGQTIPMFLKDGRPAVWACGTTMKLLTGELPR
jgi:WD40 repeat protein